MWTLEDDGSYGLLGQVPKRELVEVQGGIWTELYPIRARDGKILQSYWFIGGKGQVSESTSQSYNWWI